VNRKGTGPSSVERRPEIDYVKGLAIIFVFFIHAQPLRESWFHEYVINRAVPMFLVLFGTTSQLWWESHHSLGTRTRLGQWYLGRFKRLVPPVWAVLTVWWVLSLWVPGYPRFSLRLAAANYLGYAPAIGTFWFVTLVFQLILLYPLLDTLLDRFGAPLCLAFSALFAVLAHVYAIQLTAAMRHLLRESAPVEGLTAFYPLWIFAPQYFWLVFGGMAAARYPKTATGTDCLVFITITAASSVLHSFVVPAAPLAAAGVQRLSDLPLTYAVLALASFCTPPRLPGRFLSWCGRHSWGLYLSQMLVHDIADRLGLWPPSLGHVARWTYLLFLFAVSAAIVPAANALRAWPAKLSLARSSA